MLSFIIPIYKKNHILDKCIKSLLDQSLREWEAIFVLDGPDEEAEHTIHRMMKKKSNHYKVIEIEHGGAPRARNRGFEHAKGEYIVFWDSDCLIEVHAAKAWVDIFEREPKIGFIYAGYKFVNEAGAINTEVFDPWLLKVNNYISTCFPLRRELFPSWNEELKSLQDWDFWLSIVEKGAVGKMMQGYAFSTEFPDKGSISGLGCTPGAWLERMDAVRKLHGISDKSVCVSSLSYKHDGISLAKYIDADYRDVPNYHPHRYKTIIQVGFSLSPARAETHCKIFSEPDIKKIIFWQPDDIFEIYNRMSFSAILKYRLLLNQTVTQYVEDKNAQDLMKEAGFKTTISPMPMFNDNPIASYPAKPKFAVDIDPSYSSIFKILDKSLPDIELEPMAGCHSIHDYTGIVHFFLDKTLSNELKRAALTGRHIISNVKGPYLGYIDDTGTPEQFMTEFVDKIRTLAKKPSNEAATAYYKNELAKDGLMETLCV